MDSKPGRFAAVWATALAQYTEVTGKKLDDSALSDIKTVAALEASLKLRNDKFLEFRQSYKRVFHSLAIALKPIELVGNLAAGGAATAFPPSTLIFGAVTYLIGAAHGVSAAYNAIEDLFGALKVLSCNRLPTWLRHLRACNCEEW